MNPASLISHIGAGAKSSSKLLVVLMLLGAGLASAQTSPSDIASRMETSTRRQMLSIERMKTAAMKAAMKTPPAAQTRSVTSEPKTGPHGDFFLLPPPAVGPPLFVKPECEPLPVAEVDELVTQAGDASSVSPDLLRSVMKQESGFRPCAVSEKGAMGLMQLMETTANDFGVRNAFDPRENVTAGARLMRQLINLYDGDLTLALSAYNAGSGRVDPSFGIPKIPETMDYVNKVLSVLQASELTKAPQSRGD
jgi:soluble lytic murein transglycosylase-like protein